MNSCCDVSNACGRHDCPIGPLPALFHATLPQLVSAMNNPSYTHEFRQMAWRELCLRCAKD